MEWNGCVVDGGERSDRNGTGCDGHEEDRSGLGVEGRGFKRKGCDRERTETVKGGGERKCCVTGIMKSVVRMSESKSEKYTHGALSARM